MVSLALLDGKPMIARVHRWECALQCSAIWTALVAIFLIVRMESGKFTFFKFYKLIFVVVFDNHSSLSHQVSTHTYLALERVFGLTTFILLWLVPN